MSLTSQAYDDRFWRNGDLRALRKIAEGWKVPDHVYGWSSASTNRFDSLQEHLKLLTVLAENRGELEKSVVLQELGDKGLNELHENFQRLRGETSYWVDMLQSLADETRRLESDIRNAVVEKLVRGTKSE